MSDISAKQHISEAIGSLVEAQLVLLADRRIDLAMVAADLAEQLRQLRAKVATNADRFDLSEADGA